MEPAPGICPGIPPKRLPHAGVWWAMGLDIVELFLEIEEEFQITIPNRDAAKLARLGDIHGYVVSALRQNEGPAVDPADVWERLKKVLIRGYPVTEEQLVA